MRTLNIDEFWPSRPLVTPHSAAQGSIADTTFAGAASAHRYREPAALSAWEQPDDDAAFGSNPPSLQRKAAQRAINFLRTFDAAAAVYAALGFIAGIAAWHAIGFWGFVSAVVLNSGATVAPAAWNEPLKTVVQRPSSIATGPMITGSLEMFSPSRETCVALVINRGSGQTSQDQCRDDTQPMRDAGRRRRGDRAAGVLTQLEDTKTWAAGTEFDTAADASPTDIQTLEPSDVNLDLNVTP